MWNLLPPELSSLAIIHPFTEPVLCASRTSGGTVRHRILLEQLARNRQACERAIKEEDQPEEGNFRIPTCASIRVRGRKVMARERLHRAPCPLVRKVTCGGTDLPSLFLSLSLSSFFLLLLFFFPSSTALPHRYSIPPLYLSLSLSSVFPRHHHRRTQSYPNNFVQHKATLDRISGRSPSKLKNYANAYATRFFGEDARQ